jgi:hypothetical protein
MITTTFETINPAAAQAMLSGNVENRKIREHIVTQYAEDMAAGRWKSNGAAIVFDGAGNLIDGQHRLNGVVTSGVTIESVVVRGVERDTRDTIDINSVRSSGDILQMFLVPNGNNVAALCRLVISWERGDGKSLGSVKNIGKAAVIERAKVDERLQYAVSVANSCRHVVRCAPTAFCRYVIPNSSASDAFFRSLAEGVGLDHGSPILTLRNWALRVGKTVPFQHSIEATLRAWCAFRDERSLSMFKLTGEFPKL